MNASLTFPIFLYALLGMLGLGTFLTEAKYGPQTAILICGFYLAAAYLQKWFFDADQMFKKKGKSDTVDQIIFAGESVDTEVRAALEKRTLNKVLNLPVQIKLRIGMFGLLGIFVSLVLNHTLHMHFTLFFHLITALLILPAMTPNHFMLPCVVNLLAVGYGFASSDTPDVFLYSIYVLVFMFVLMSFGNVLREVKQTQAKPLPLAHLTVRTAVSAVQTGVAYLLLLGVVDYFIPHPGKKQQQKAGLKSTMMQVEAMLGRAMPDAFKPQPGPSGAPNPSGKEDQNGMNPQPSPGGPGQIPSATPAQGPSAKPEPSAQPSSDPSAKPSANPSANPEKPPSPPPFPLPSTMPSLSPEQIQSMAREALRQGIFDEKDLKRGELNLKPEVQKLLNSENVKEAMEKLKKMAEQAKETIKPNITPDAKSQAPRSDPKATTTGAPRPVGMTGEEKERKELEQSMKNILDQARAAMADTKIKPQQGDKKNDEASTPTTAKGRDSGGSGGGGAIDAAFDRVKKKELKENKSISSWVAKTAEKIAAKMTQAATAVVKKVFRPKEKFDLAAMVDDLFTPILLAIVLSIIWYIRRKLKKKADPKRMLRAQLARDQRAEILERLKELGSGKLSAREEVIARYDLFLKIMEFAATPRELYLPPTDFWRRIRYVHPPLEGQSKQITEIFCDVFYGDFSAGAEEVKKSRGAVKEIFHYFAD